MRFLSRFVDSNDREIRRIQPWVDEANGLEAEFERLSDDEIRAQFAEIRDEIRGVAEPEEPSDDELHHEDLERRRELTKARRKRENEKIQSALDEVLPEVFAMAREAMKRTLDMRHFDVQLIGGAVLHQGRIAEMRTGEGKTLVAPLAAILNAMTGRGVHVVTVNDYLARRDPQWMGPIYHFLGVSVGMITHDTSYVFEPGYPTTDERLINLRPVERREAYAADVTYGTNNEFGFDYLRDNMVLDLQERVQRERSFAIVDEVDNILIDEARTPLIISGQAEESADLYYTFARLVPRLKERPEGAEEGGDYFIDLKDRAVSPTEEGVDKMEGFLNVENLYDADPRLARHFEQALRAHALYKRDRDYIVKDGEIIIVDEFTGRQMPGRRWSEGLHQAIEAKEGLRIQRESVTMATITFQNYFRLYDKLSGMTGTAMTEAEEFHKIYNLEVVAIPTHREMIREDSADLVFRDEKAKFNALIDEIVEMQEAGRPVLVGTVSVEKSEILSAMLKRRGVKHETLNAKFHEKESGIVAQAGRTGAVTIATNMAGRGTDILLGGNPAGLASEALHRQGLNPAEVDRGVYEAALADARAQTEDEHVRVVEAGGLHIIGTERHDSRRIDNQLRGRAGRQGDPGSSRFYLSLDDDLMKRFASERVTGLMERLGLEEDVAIESRLVSKTIESAQSRVEGFNFDIRKRVVEFDDVINKQRETIYAERDKVLHNEDLTETVRAFLDEEIDALVDQHLAGEDAEAWAFDALSAALTAMGLTDDSTTADALWELGGRESIADHLRELADAALEARETEVGPEDWAQVERFVLLRTIDSLWIEHLTEVDDMRRGIGLRGYAQQDPLNEFRREAYRLYEELRGLIRHGVATSIFRVTVQRQPPPDQALAQSLARGAAALTAGAGRTDGNGARAGRPAPVGAGSTAAAGSTASAAAGSAILRGSLPAGPTPSNLRESLGDQPVPGGNGAGGAGGARPGYTPTGARIGRNDPCWCGSGQKYKKCHGR
ncbi:MAG TPA: preprotein translocase subunit SecA [Candidatus Limnocylindrales bacterium]|jgi:preprotein translocase subunit SecA|nr:preprotein translocase subunit SecA [Candidatus Limnocylindrales bacterium]